MTDSWPGERRAGDTDEHFLVDGLAPSVIGGADGPDPELGEDYDDEPPRAYHDPPTAPIPAQGTPRPAQGHVEERKPSWLGRMFGR
jgi:hypothetical protein